MKSISKDQIRAVHVTIKSKQLDKEDVIWQCTAGRTTSVSQMTFMEAKELLQALNDTDKPKADKKNSAANKMRRKILSYCHTMRYPKHGGKLDMSKVDEAIARLGYLKSKGKTRLNDYTVEELPTLVTQWQRMADHYLTKKSNERPK